jgi:hypothetical protein
MLPKVLSMEACSGHKKAPMQQRSVHLGLTLVIIFSLSTKNQLVYFYKYSKSAKTNFSQ